MNAKKLVKATNIIGMVAVTLLVYWVFALILIQVFGLKVFREHITEIFLMSILGILAVMGGTLMLNIMLNLTRIAERGQEEEVRGGKYLPDKLRKCAMKRKTVITAFAILTVKTVKPSYCVSPIIRSTEKSVAEC